QHQEVGKKVARLIEEIDPELVLLDADVNVHAADHEPPPDPGKIPGECLVALALGWLLRAPARKGVGGGSNRCEAMRARELGDGEAHVGKLAAGRRRRRVDGGADLDLRFEELWRHLPRQGRLRGLEETWRQVANEVPARALNEEIFLLDADAK